MRTQQRCLFNSGNVWCLLVAASVGSQSETSMYVRNNEIHPNTAVCMYIPTYMYFIR